MTALTITAGSVATTSTNVIQGTAGATITAGQALYLDAVTTTWKLALCSGTAAQALVGGVSLNGASSGQPITVLVSGAYTVGATVTKGIWYIAGTVAGTIAPVSDIATTNYSTHFAFATSTTVLTVFLNPTINAVVQP